MWSFGELWKNGVSQPVEESQPPSGLEPGNPTDAMTEPMPSTRKRKHPLAGVRAIVTDAQTRLGLYVIRALGRAGCRVTAVSGSETESVIGFSSRYVHRRHRLPCGSYWDTLPDGIEDIASEHDVLVPITTFSMSVVQSSLERLMPLIRFQVPPGESFRTAVDKRATSKAAAELGVPIPHTFHNLEPSTIADWIQENPDLLPLVIKFADEDRSEAWDPAERYRIVRTPEEFCEEFRRMHAIAENPVVQEYVEGDGYGFFTVMAGSGEPVGVFCHRRLREYPTSGGPSTLCESVYDSTLVDHGLRLLRGLDWEGPAMAEFKRDRRSGEYKLLEINPRFWGSLPLSIHCGVDFPVYHVQLALGRSPTPPTEYPIGRKMRYLVTDFLAVTQQWRHGDKGRVAWDYLKELLDPRIKDGLFEFTDPKPGMTYVSERMRR